MKTFVLICFVVYLSSIAFSQEDLSQSFENGSINWETMTITAVGTGESESDISPARQRASAIAAAATDARESVLAAFKSLNLIDKQTVNNLLLESSYISEQINNTDIELKFVGKPRLMPDSTVELTVEYILSEKLLDIILPSSSFILTKYIIGPQPEKPEPLYTGLIVDCRNLDVNYALAPRIFNEEGVEIYGPNWVDREQVLEIGFVQYINSETIEIPEGGSNPYIVKGVMTVGQNNCDVVIADSDAIKLMNSVESLSFLNIGKVIFIVDKGIIK